MARPKEHSNNTGYQSAAFHDKCLKEKDRIRVKISQQLRDDVLRMLSEEIHTDLIVTNGTRTIQAHKSIFLTRVGSIFPELQVESEDKVTLSNLNSQDLESLVREVYYVEDVNYFYSCKEYFPHLNGESHGFRRNGDESAITLGPQADSEDQDSPSDGATDSPELAAADEGIDINDDQEPLDTGSIRVTMETEQNNVTMETNSNQNHKDEQVNGQHDEGLIANGEESTLSFSKMKVKDCTESPVEVPSMRDDTERSHELSRMIKLSYSLSLPHETCSKLGADLLRMFLQEIGWDTTLVVDGHEFRAHRCILASRSSYFQAMFGGLWSESGADKVVLEGASLCGVEQLLLFLYGGVIDVIDECELTQLLHVADMYGIDGLKDVVAFHLRKDSCHFFHKPCPTCETTVAYALTVAVSYRLDELRDRLLKWINKFFTKLVATKQFASMPDTVLGITYNSLVDQLTDQTVIDMILECHKLTSKMPRVKWAEPLQDLTARLMDAAIEFTSQHFVSVVQSQRFLQSGKNAAWSVSVLEDIFSNVIDALPPHKACEAYRALLDLYQHSLAFETSPWGEDMQLLLSTLISYNETYMKHYIHQVTLSPAWRLLPADIRDRILKSSNYVCIDQDLTMMSQPPQLSNKKTREESRRGRPGPGPRPNSARSASSRGSTNSQVRRTPDRPASAHSSPKVKGQGVEVTRSKANKLQGSPRQTAPRPTGNRPLSGEINVTRSQRSPDDSSQRVKDSGSGPSSSSSARQLSMQSASARKQTTPPKLHQRTPDRQPTPSRVNSMTPDRQTATPPRLHHTTPKFRQLTPPKTYPSMGSRQTTPSRLQQSSSFGNVARQSLTPSPTPRGGSRSRLPERINTSLRPARSTGSLTRSHDLQASQRSASTANLDTDAWGLKRREHSTLNLDQLVPILEMSFTQPSDENN